MDENEKYESCSEIGALLKEAREERKRLREDICEGIMQEEELRALEEGKEYEFWQMRILTGRLHILDSAFVFYLNTADDKLVDLETEIRYCILFWRYGEAEELLNRFYDCCDPKTRFRMQVYYQLDGLLKIRQNRKGMADSRELREFVEKEMPDFEERLQSGAVFSPSELALMVVYYQMTQEDPEQRLRKLYHIVHYYETEFAKDKEKYVFYAELRLACAQCLYESGDYVNCIKQCEEGEKVAKYFRQSTASGEFREWMADAKGEILRKELAEDERREYKGREISKEERREFYKRQLREDEERKRQVLAILEDYGCANALYGCYYFGYQEGHKAKLERKMEEWKIMMSEKSWE